MRQRETLAGLKTMPQIVSARLELTDGQRLAVFGATHDEVEIKSARVKFGFPHRRNRILLAQPVIRDGKREGTLYLLADLHAMSSQLLKLYAGIFALVLAASLLLAFVLSSRFQRFITTPILGLAETAHTIADRQGLFRSCKQSLRRRSRRPDGCLQSNARADPIAR